MTDLFSKQDIGTRDGLRARLVDVIDGGEEAVERSEPGIGRDVVETQLQLNRSRLERLDAGDIAGVASELADELELWSGTASCSITAERFVDESRALRELAARHDQTDASTADSAEGFDQDAFFDDAVSGPDRERAREREKKRRQRARRRAAGVVSLTIDVHESDVRWFRDRATESRGQAAKNLSEGVAGTCPRNDISFERGKQPRSPEKPSDHGDYR